MRHVSYSSTLQFQAPFHDTTKKPFQLPLIKRTAQAILSGNHRPHIVNIRMKTKPRKITRQKASVNLQSTECRGVKEQRQARKDFEQPRRPNSPGLLKYSLQMSTIFFTRGGPSAVLSAPSSARAVSMLARSNGRRTSMDSHRRSVHRDSHSPVLSSFKMLPGDFSWWINSRRATVGSRSEACTRKRPTGLFS